MPTKEQIIEQLETVIDPEIGIDIWTMGLIYNIDIKSEKSVHILMTFTTPACPAGPSLQQEVTDALRSLGFEDIEVEITFEPVWKPSQELKEALGMPTSM